MPALIKYALLLAADLTIIGCLVHYFFATLHWYTPPFERPDRNPPELEKLTAYSYYVVVCVSAFLSLFGALSFLFSWMPHRWGTYDEGEWTTTATALSMLGAFYGTILLVGGLGKTAKKVSDLQLRQTRAEAFYRLLQREVGHFGSILRHPESAADRFAKTEQEIEEAERTQAIFVEDARVCRDLVAVLRRATSVPGTS